MLPSGPSPLTVPEPADWIFEADPAAVRAHALGELCRQHGLLALGDSNGYLTGGSLVASEWLRPWKVIWHGPYRPKVISGVLQQHGARVEVVKTRGGGIDPEEARKVLSKCKGLTTWTLLIWKRGQSLRCALAEPADRHAKGPDSSPEPSSGSPLRVSSAERPAEPAQVAAPER